MNKKYLLMGLLIVGLMSISLVSAIPIKEYFEHRGELYSFVLNYPNSEEEMLWDLNYMCNQAINLGGWKVIRLYVSKSSTWTRTMCLIRFKRPDGGTTYSSIWDLSYKNFDGEREISMWGCSSPICGTYFNAQHTALPVPDRPAPQPQGVPEIPEPIEQEPQPSPTEIPPL